MPSRTEQKAFAVHATVPEAGGLTELEALTAHLNDGWRLVSATPMGGAGDGGAIRFAALVVLERDSDRPVSGFGP